MDDPLLRRRSRVLRDLVTLVFVGLTAVFGLMVVSTGAEVLRGHSVAAAVLYQVPLALYLWAIWMVRSALAKIARGALFDSVVPRLLARMGWALAIGALFNVVGAPAIAILFRMPGAGALLMFNPAAITVGVIGFLLVLVSRLLTGAAAMRAELDEMF